jgi:hypothetical protein
MQRMIGVVAAAMLVSMNGAGASATTDAGTAVVFSSLDVTALLTAAHGAPPMICALAAHSVRGNSWGEWSDAPATPLGIMSPASRDMRDLPFADADVDKLLGGLGSDDACVRELSIRLLGGQKSDKITNQLITRLGSPDASMREVASFGLGMLEPAGAIDPLT